MHMAVRAYYGTCYKTNQVRGVPGPMREGLTIVAVSVRTVGQHSASDWNRILFTLNQANCEDDTDFEEVKTRAAKKPGSMPAFTPSKRVKLNESEDKFFPMV
jgi:hypothetical protein